MQLGNDSRIGADARLDVLSRIKLGSVVKIWFGKLRTASSSYVESRFEL